MAALALTTLLGVAMYGLISGPGQDGANERATPVPISRPLKAPVSQSDPVTAPPELIATPDPVAYAESVAEVLFTWDTVSDFDPTQPGERLLLDADPSGYEITELVTDLANYLPSPAVWLELREYGVRQWLILHSSAVPDSWPATAESAGDQIRDGTFAVTIEATRMRAGTWFQEPHHSADDLAFTVFVGCQPSFDRCHLLRLSRLNHPLR